MPVVVQHEKLRPIDIYRAMLKREASGAKYTSAYAQYRRGLLSLAEYESTWKDTEEMNRQQAMERMERVWDALVCSTLTTAEIESALIDDLISGGATKAQATHWARIFMDS